MNDTAMAGLILSTLGAVGALVVTLLRFQHGINEQFQRLRTESEDRAVVTHKRIDALGEKIDETYVRKDLHQEQMDGMKREMAHLRATATCPAARGEG